MGTGAWSVGDEITAVKLNQLFQSDFWGADIGTDTCFSVGSRGAFVTALVGTEKKVTGLASGVMRCKIHRCATSSPVSTITEFVSTEHIYNTDGPTDNYFYLSAQVYVPYNSDYPWCWLRGDFVDTGNARNLNDVVGTFKYINL